MYKYAEFFRYLEDAESANSTPNLESENIVQKALEEAIEFYKVKYGLVLETNGAQDKQQQMKDCLQKNFIRYYDYMKGINALKEISHTGLDLKIVEAIDLSAADIIKLIEESAIVDKSNLPNVIVRYITEAPEQYRAILIKAQSSQELDAAVDYFLSYRVDSLAQSVIVDDNFAVPINRWFVPLDKSLLRNYQLKYMSATYMYQNSNSKESDDPTAKTASPIGGMTVEQLEAALSIAMKSFSNLKRSSLSKEKYLFKKVQPILAVEKQLVEAYPKRSKGIQAVCNKLNQTLAYRLLFGSSSNIDVLKAFKEYIQEYDVQEIFFKDTDDEAAKNTKVYDQLVSMIQKILKSTEDTNFNYCDYSIAISGYNPIVFAAKAKDETSSTDKNTDKKVPTTSAIKESFKLVRDSHTYLGASTIDVTFLVKYHPVSDMGKLCGNSIPDQGPALLAKGLIAALNTNTSSNRLLDGETFYNVTFMEALPNQQSMELSKTKHAFVIRVARGESKESTLMRLWKRKKRGY